MGRCFLRIRVAMEVAKPLVTGFWVTREGNRKVWVKIKYEKISDFCFECGWLGHVWKSCEYGGEVRDMGEGMRRYGLWLKATPIKEMEAKYRPKGGGFEWGKREDEGKRGDGFWGRRVVRMDKNGKGEVAREHWRRGGQVEREGDDVR
ncbi:hypothetical protein CRYUN_Cryun26dG0125300 [Craigia yunnanensis]